MRKKNQERKKERNNQRGKRKGHFRTLDVVMGRSDDVSDVLTVHLWSNHL